MILKEFVDDDSNLDEDLNEKIIGKGGRNTCWQKQIQTMNSKNTLS